MAPGVLQLSQSVPELVEGHGSGFRALRQAQGPENKLRDRRKGSGSGERCYPGGYRNATTEDAGIVRVLYAPGIQLYSSSVTVPSALADFT